MNAQNKIKDDIFKKLCQVFKTQLTGDEAIEELIGVKWYEIETGRALDYFTDDIYYLGMAEEIDLSSYGLITVNVYCNILSECYEKGLDDEILFCNDSVEKIKRRLSTWRRAIPIMVILLSVSLMLMLMLMFIFILSYKSLQFY